MTKNNLIITGIVLDVVVDFLYEMSHFRPSNGDTFQIDLEGNIIHSWDGPESFAGGGYGSRTFTYDKFNEWLEAKANRKLDNE